MSGFLEWMKRLFGGRQRSAAASAAQTERPPKSIDQGPDALDRLIAERCGIAPAQAQKLVNEIFGSMRSALARGEDVDVEGFGAFRVKRYAGYTGRNPKSGAEIAVRAKSGVLFEVSRELKERLNQSARPPARPAARAITSVPEWSGSARARDPSFIHAVEMLRAAGFFAHRRDTPPEQLARELDAELRDISQYEPRTTLQLQLMLVNLDEARVWHRDTEMGVGAGNGRYEATLQEWAAISGGAFAPRSIVETWDAEEGPVTVTFELNGERRTLRPEVRDDFLDAWGCLREINRMVRGEIRFAVVDTQGQDAMVLALNARELAHLRGELHWPIFYP